MIKNYSGVIVKIDEKGKEEVIARTKNKELAKIATKQLNMAEKIKVKVEQKEPFLEPEEGGGIYFIDKYKRKYI